MPAPKPPTEHAEQRALITWAHLQAAKHPELHLLHAIPNGGHRSKAAAGKLKAEGVKPGVPDLFLPLRTLDHTGCYIELKRTQNSRTSPEQDWWHQHLRAQGFAVHLAKGAEPAIQILQHYLTLPRPPDTPPVQPLTRTKRTSSRAERDRQPKVARPGTGGGRDQRPPSPSPTPPAKPPRPKTATWRWL